MPGLAIDSALPPGVLRAPAAPALAIEIVTLLGDTVVDVTYRSAPVPSRLRRVLATIAVGCLVSSAAAFGLAVATAAHNAADLDRWTTVAKRPAYAFRPARDSSLLDVLAFGGLALGVCAATGALLCRRREQGPIALAGETVTLDELAALTGTIETGPATYMIRNVGAPEPAALRPRRFERRPIVFAAGSLAVHVGLLWLMSRAPLEGDPDQLTLAMLDPVRVPEESGAPEQPPPPEEPEHGTYVHGPSMDLARPVSTRWHDSHIRIQPVEPMTREQAVEAARSAGVLQSELLSSGVLSSLDSLPDFGTSFDGADIYGGLIGNEPAYEGSFGFGASGFGVCGAIHGTIGTGASYATLGWGRGGGANYTTGPRGHAAHTPTTSLGQPVRTGDYDKAIIRRYIKRNLTKITYCYEKELLAKPALAGTLAVQFLIAPNGSVQTAIATGVDDNVASCVADVIRAIEFPRPRDGAPVQVNYPLIVRPAGS